MKTSPIMKKARYILAVTVLLAFSQCGKDDYAPSIRIEMGAFFCECIGNCSYTFEVSATTQSFQVHEWCTENSTVVRSCSRPIEEQDFQNLSNLVDWEAFNALEEVIGCPDCADGGGQWIEIARGNETYRVTYEYGNPPALLQPLANALAPLQDSLSASPDCQ